MQVDVTSPWFIEEGEERAGLMRTHIPVPAHISDETLASISTEQIGPPLGEKI